MKKILLMFLIFLVTVGIAYAAVKYEAITVADTAIGLTAANIKADTTRVYCTLETAQIRFRTDGTAPTSTTGHLLESGAALELYSYDDIVKFKAIRTGATSGALKCSYW